MNERAADLLLLILKFQREGKIKPNDIPLFIDDDEERDFFYYAQLKWTNTDLKSKVEEGDIETVERWSEHVLKDLYNEDRIAFKKSDYSDILKKLKTLHKETIRPLTDKFEQY